MLSAAASVQNSSILPRLCERRAAVRYHRDFEITGDAFPEGQQPQWNGRVQDISTSGIGVLVDCYFEPETFLSVELPGEGPIETYTFLVQVVRAQAHGESQWLLGCTFGRELSETELRALL